ncbi:MAG: DUF4276 family protein [Acidobacteria bacterium]|nr:DUF4276 family protein [Acidobacteriota bacterium]
MDEPSYGLIVEGFYDKAVLTQLVQKIESADAKIVVRVCRDAGRLMGGLSGYLRELAGREEPIDKALVVRDADGLDPTALEEEMAQRVQGMKPPFPRGVHFCAVQQAMEAWLLADVDAIDSVARERSGRSAELLQGEPEEIAKPKSVLRHVLWHAKLPYDAEVCREIASRVDLKTLRDRCPSFRSFEKKVLDC